MTSVLIWADRLQEAIETAHRGLSYLHRDLSAGRGHLLAILAEAQATAGIWEPANEALCEALKIASHTSDPKLAARLHRAQLSANYQFLRLKEAAADGEKSRGSDTPSWEGAITLQLLYQALLFLGRLDDAAKIRDELEPLATRIGQSYSVSRCLIIRAWVDFGTTPELERLESVLSQVLESDPKVPAVFWRVFAQVQLSLVDFLGGDWASAAQHARASYEHEAETSRRGMGAGTFYEMAFSAHFRSSGKLVGEETDLCIVKTSNPNVLMTKPADDRHRDDAADLL